MKSKPTIQLIVSAIIIFLFPLVTSSFAKEGTIILCYHDVPKEVHLDNYGADQESFINTIEYLKSHDYTFISLDDFVQSKNGNKELPEKSILLTFDDAYTSYYEFVHPMLKEYKIPSTLAVVTSWIEKENPEYNIKHDLMSWDQIREVSRSPYVDVISHSHDLHKGILSNPQGNKPAAAVNRLFDEENKKYENIDEYEKRIQDDLKTSKQILEEKIGKNVDTIAWPYGLYNEITAKLATEAGFKNQFTLNDQVVRDNYFDQIHRFLIHKNPTIIELRTDLKLIPNPIEQKRIVQVDLDMIYDPDPIQTEKNLSSFLNRIKDLRVTTVYLQAFSDNDANGNIRQVYFPNRVLPMKQDLFSRVAYQLRGRTEVEVYAWMPMLSLDLPEEMANDDLYVREYSNGETQVTSSWYKRLSPFSLQAQELLAKLYEDLAISTHIDGIVFQDDGYLNEKEDFHPAAVEHYNKITGKSEIIAPDKLSMDQTEAWTEVKIQKLNELAEKLKNVVKRYRPDIHTARTLYAPVILDRFAKKRFSQSYQKSLELYDHVVIMAYPYLEEVKHPIEWFEELVALAKRQPFGVEKTVFKVQTYDWSKKKWVKSRKLNKWFKALISSGAKHIAYYPDDYVLNNPKERVIREMMSVEDFPFKRDWK